MAQNQKGDYQIVEDPALGTHVKGMTKVTCQFIWFSERFLHFFGHLITLAFCLFYWQEVVETEEECLNLLFQGIDMRALYACRSPTILP